jgi:hypothetical protein
MLGRVFDLDKAILPKPVSLVHSSEENGHMKTDFGRHLHLACKYLTPAAFLLISNAFLLDSRSFWFSQEYQVILLANVFKACLKQFPYLHFCFGYVTMKLQLLDSNDVPSTSKCVLLL